MTIRCWNKKISPWRILAVTFTNKAAKEMRERLEKLVGINESKEMTIGTFHAICARVLRYEADYLAPVGLNKSFVIFDTENQMTLIKQAIRELNLDDKQYRPMTIQGMISRAKNDMYGPEQMAERAAKYIEEVAARVYKVYQKLLRANNGVDFDDLLMMTEQLWRREAEVLQKYQKRWHYIHVDEFQDCNLPQYKLVRLLGYGTAENVQRFERDFPHTKIVMLEQNYRSTQTILDAAQGVVRRNTMRKDKSLWTALGKGEKLIYHEAYNEEEEGLYTAREISRLLARGDIQKRGEVAVMYRTNAQSRALEEQFLRANIPYKVIGSRKFYERKEIKDMLAYLRLLANPHDEMSLQRIINVPNRKIGPRTVGELKQWADEKKLPLYDAIQQVEHHPTLGRAAKTALAGFGQLMIDLVHAMDELQLPELMDRIAEKSGLGPELRASADHELDRWANVLELRRVAEDYSEIETHAALELFLENVALVGGADTTQSSEDGTLLNEENNDAVTLITLHAAKGLEYPVVFIVGMDEGSLPHSRSVDKPEQLEEERRLAYVGFTRAMQRLYLVRARRRSFWGESQPTEPSRFLEDIPLPLIARGGASSTRSNRRGEQDEDDYDFNQDTYSTRESGRTYGRGTQETYSTGRGTTFGSRRAKPETSSSRSSTNSSPAIPPSSRPASRTSSSNVTPPLSPKERSPQQPAEPVEPKVQQYKAGDRVRHDKFGDGIVLKSEMLNDTEFLDVQFAGKHGKKRLSMDFANLEKL